MDDVASSKYRLSLLGRFELTGQTGPVELPSKKLAGLLAYLACTAPQPQSPRRGRTSARPCSGCAVSWARMS
jgi:hypothetical protein